ncbi:MAG: S53 family peptidase [Verrucomicrobiota bacterium]
MTYKSMVSTACAVFLVNLAVLALPNPQAGPPDRINIGGPPDGINIGGPPDWVARPPLHVLPMVASATPYGYNPMQIRHAYGLDQLTNGGAGQVIAIVDAYGSPTIQSDLNVFCSQFGIPTATIQIVKTSNKPLKVDAGWALETSLDVEWAHALAPNAKIILVAAASASVSDLVAGVDAAVKAGATIVTMSWGTSEFPTESSYESHFKKAGVSFFASSGDGGSGAEWPAASPNVTGVGGTTLYLDASGNLTSPEVAWSGSGGGFSAYFARPAYQNGWQTSGSRAIPDVAMVANPNTGVAVYVSTTYNNQSGWFQVGGTSASCPMWGAVVALANQSRVSAKKATLSGTATPLYLMAGSTDSTGASIYGYFFNDVTSGSNGGFSATPKYDEVTGLGSPITQNSVPGLAAY